MNEEKKQPNINQIIFIDLNYKDKWDRLKKTRPYLIIEIKKKDNFFFLRLLIITSQDKTEIRPEERIFITQHEIFSSPQCLIINPSFARIHRSVCLKIISSKLTDCLCKKCFEKECFEKREYDYLVKKHKDYRINKLNESRLRPTLEVKIG